MLNLRSLKEFPATVSFDVDAAGMNIVSEGLTFVGTAHIQLTIIRSDLIYYCNGEVTCDATLECSRCLEPYPAPLKGKVEFSIQEAEKKSLDPDEIPENEIVVSPGTSEVDITYAIREAILLEIPMKPLCSDGCLGLCPQCGSNRNERTCECKTDTIDSRWDGLKNLMPDNGRPDRK